MAKVVDTICSCGQVNCDQVNPHHVAFEKWTKEAYAWDCSIDGHWYEWADPHDDTKGEVCINCGKTRPFAW